MTPDLRQAPSPEPDPTPYVLKRFSRILETKELQPHGSYRHNMFVPREEGVTDLSPVKLETPPGVDIKEPSMPTIPGPDVSRFERFRLKFGPKIENLEPEVGEDEAIE